MSASLAAQAAKRTNSARPAAAATGGALTAAVGIAAELGPKLGDLLAAAHRRLLACDCGRPGGCPGCIQIARCGEYNEGLSRQACDIVLRWSLGMEWESHLPPLPAKPDANGDGETPMLKGDARETETAERLCLVCGEG